MSLNQIPTIPANGADIPAFGLGTWELREAVAAQMVAEALKMGVRHIDTARRYANEKPVGDGIRASGVPREQVFVTSKVWWEDLEPARFAAAADAVLADLDIGYLDLLLIHWPNPAVPLADTLRALADVKRKGLARHVGVANFPIALLDEAVARCHEPLACNQVEFHPYLDQSGLLAACRRHGLALTAYSPLAIGRIVKEPMVVEIAAARGRTPGQIALRWLVQQDGVAVIPRSSKVERIRENASIFDFTLSEEEMARIKALARPDGRFVSPSWHPDWD